MAQGDIATYRPTATQNINSTSFVDLNLAGADVQEGDFDDPTAVTKNLPNNRVLAIHSLRHTRVGDTNRTDAEIAFAFNGAEITTGRSSGYIRRSGNADETHVTGAVILPSGVGNTVALRGRRRDSQSPTTVEHSVQANNGGLQLLEIGNVGAVYNAVANVTKNTAGIVTGTAVPLSTIASSGLWANVDWDVEAEVGTGFATIGGAGGDEIQVPAEKIFLTYGIDCAHASGSLRRNIVARIQVRDGSGGAWADIDSSFCTAYLRGSNGSQNMWANTFGIFDFSGFTDPRVRVQFIEECETGSRICSYTSAYIQMMVFPSTAEYIMIPELLADDTSITSTFANMSWGLSDEENATAFDRLGNAIVRMKKTEKYMFFSQFCADRSLNDATRKEPQARWFIEAVEIANALGRFSNYSRGDQSTTSTHIAGRGGGLIYNNVLADAELSVRTGDELIATTDGLRIPASRMALQGVNIPSLFASAPNDPIEQLVENFDANSLPANFSTTIQTAGGSVLNQNERVEIFSEAGGEGSNFLGETSDWSLIDSQFAFEHEYDGGGESLKFCWLSLFSFENGSFDSGLQFRINFGDLNCYRRDEGSLTLLDSRVYDPVAHRWLRWRETSGTTYFEASPNGVTWTVLASEATVVPLDLCYPEMFIFSNGTSPTGVTLILDNYNTGQQSITKPMSYAIRRTLTAIQKGMQYTVQASATAITKAMQYVITQAGPIVEQVYTYDGSSFISTHTINNVNGALGNLVVVAVANRRVDEEVDSVTIDGITATRTGLEVNTSVAGVEFFWVYSESFGSALDVVISTPTFKIASATIWVISGADSTPIDVENVSDQQFSDDATETITTLTANSLILGATNTQGANPFTPITDTVEDSDFDNGNASLGQMTGFHRNVGPTGAYTVGATIASSDNWATSLLAIKPAVGGLCPKAGWSGRAPLTIPASNINSNLTDYVVAVNLADMPAEFWANVKSDGGDIRVTTSDGDTEVPIHVSSFDDVTDEGVLFFKTALSATVDNEFFIYVGNASANLYADTDPLGRNAVYTAYEAVYHFNETPDGSAGDITDSTGNGNDGTSTNLSGADIVAGIFSGGSAYQFNEASPKYITLPDIMGGATALTVSYFINNPVYDDGRAVSSGGSGVDQVLIWPDNDNGFDSIVDSARANGGAVESATGWNVHAMRYTGATVNNIENGIADGSVAKSGAIISRGPNYIGRNAGTGNESNDILAGVRIALQDLGDDYLEAEAINMRTPLTFYNVGTYEACSGPAPTPVNIQKSMGYEVSVTEPAVTKPMAYRVKTNTLTQLGMGYEVSVLAVIQKAMAYLVRTSQSITKTMGYTVTITAGAVTKGMQYMVRTSQLIQKAMGYEVSASDAITKQMGYRVRTSSSIQLGMGYSVTVEQAPSTLPMTYRVKQTQSDTKLMAYNVTTEATPIAKPMNYRVKSQTNTPLAMGYFVRTMNAIQVGMQYVVTGGGRLLVPMQYMVRRSQTAQLAMEYVIAVGATIQKPMGYLVRQTTAVTRQMAYSVKQTQLVQVAMQYVVTAQESIVLPMVYRVKTSPAVQLAMGYVIRAVTAIQKPMAYVVKQTNSIALQMRYAVTDTESITKPMQYLLRRRAIKEVPMAYDVVVRENIQLPMQYVITRCIPFKPATKPTAPVISPYTAKVKPTVAKASPYSYGAKPYTQIPKCD